MERACEEVQFVEARGDLAQHPSVGARLRPAILRKRRVVMTCRPAGGIVLALAVPNDVEGKGAEVGHQTWSSLFTFLPRTRNTTPCGSSRSEISCPVSPSNKPRRIRVKPPCE